MYQIQFDYKSHSILVPYEIYEALGKPDAAQFIYNQAEGLLGIVREVQVSSDRKRRIGRPAKNHGIFKASCLEEGRFVIEFAVREFEKHFPGFKEDGEQLFSVKGHLEPAWGILFDLNKAQEVIDLSGFESVWKAQFA